MEQTLLDTFEGMKMTDRQKNLFADVMVDRIQLYRNKKLMCVNLKSSHIIPYREIRLVRHNLEAVMGPVGFSVRVDDRYNLSKQYRPEDFWKEYQDSIMEILKEDNILDFNILYRGQAEMNGSMLTVTCEDDSMYRARQDKLTRRLQEIFEDKAGFHIEVEINYTEASTLEAPSQEYEYVRLEHRPQQKPAAGSDGNGTAAAPEHNSEVPWDDGAAAEGKKKKPEENKACYYTFTSVQEASQEAKTRESMVNFALQFLGNPYVWGGTSLTNGCDCSGFVHQVYAHFGISTPRYSQAFKSVGQPVSYQNIQAGDVVVYPGHVAIYIGNGNIEEAQSTRAGITNSRPVNCHTITAIRRLV